MTLEEILEQSPEIEAYGGGQWAMYGVGCCWWTSFPEDLGAIPISHLPCCPHCGSVLLQAPLEKFIQAARDNPKHYGGNFGIETFILAHSRNADFCFSDWESYELILWLKREIEEMDEDASE